MHELGERLELRRGDLALAQQADHPDEDAARLVVDLRAERLHLRPAPRVAEQHPPRVVVLGDVGDPDLQHGADALLHRPGLRDRAGECRKVVAMALEQREVQGRTRGPVQPP
jgi:hypothetical protein